MEKRIRNTKQPTRIVLIGAESTGKSTTGEALAKFYETAFVPEYARTYVENLHRDYNFADVEHIAKEQLSIEKPYYDICNRFLFIDTDLIITKIWFEEVFGYVPVWMKQKIIALKPDLYLFCKPDLEWQPDPTRENSGNRRLYLHERYLSELQYFNMPFVEIFGAGNFRAELAKSEINRRFGLK